MFSWLAALRRYWLPRAFGNAPHEEERRHPEKVPVDNDELIERRKDDEVGGES